MAIQLTDECELKLISGQSQHSVPVDFNLRRIAAILRRSTTIALTGGVTLSADQLAYRFLKFSGTGGGIVDLNQKPGAWCFRNGTGAALTIRARSSDAGQSLAVGDTVQFVSDGVNVFGMASGGVAWSNVSGKPALYTQSETDALLNAKANASSLGAHTGNTSNPHNVTAAQISALPVTAKGIANGVAPLNGTATIDSAYLPAAGAWIAPALLNGWVNFGAGTEAVGYRKNVLGHVEIKGFIKSGTAENVFVLPAGYRPTETFIVPASIESGGAVSAARILIYSDGTVVANGGVGKNFSLRVPPFQPA